MTKDVAEVEAFRTVGVAKEVTFVSEVEVTVPFMMTKDATPGGGDRPSLVTKDVQWSPRWKSPSPWA